jgi:hypothetical protein
MGRHHQPLVADIASVAKGTQSRTHPSGRIAVQRASDGWRHVALGASQTT